MALRSMAPVAAADQSSTGQRGWRAGGLTRQKSSTEVMQDQREEGRPLVSERQHKRLPLPRVGQSEGKAFGEVNSLVGAQSANETEEQLLMSERPLAQG